MYQKYLMLFYLLDYCYQNNCTDEDLPPLLGAMDPYLWGDDMPMDRAIYDEWSQKSNFIKTTHHLKQAVIEFLESYERNYDFNFKETKIMLNSLSDKEIDDIIAKIEK